MKKIYTYEKGVVIIHQSEKSAEELRAMYEAAAQRFCREVRRENENQ